MDCHARMFYSGDGNQAACGIHLIKGDDNLDCYLNVI